MVRVLANGDIVADDDPRVRGAGAGRQNAQNGRQGGIARDEDRRVMQHGPDGSILDSVNARLTGLGIPTFNIGPYPVEPIATIGFVLSLIFFGLGGLFFSGLLFFIVKYSQMGLGDGRAIRLPAWLNRLGFGGNDQAQGTPRRPGDRAQGGNPGGAGRGRNAGTGSWSGGGHRLGDG